MQLEKQASSNVQNHSRVPITFWKILKFWFPLSLNWQMMAIEGPVITGVISRLANPKLNLAAFGVAFAWALIIESPVIPLLSASAALSKSRTSYFLLRKFMWQMNGLSTILQLVFIIPPVFDFVARSILNLPDEIVRLAYEASVTMIPWSAAIGYRRFYQGIMIRAGMPHKVAIGTVLRLSAMILTASSLFMWGHMNGATVGCVTLCAAVTAEACASRVMVRSALKPLLETHPVQSERPLTYGMLLKFYVPLMITILIGLGIQPITTLALGHSVLPIESLAVLPVTNALNMFIMCSVFGVQEIVIVLVGDSFENRKRLRNFAWALGGTLSLLLILIAYSPLSLFWFTYVSSLPVALIPLAVSAAHVGVVLPMLRAWESYQRALMVKAEDTVMVTAAAIFELITVAISLYVLTQPMHVIGVIAAVLSVTCGAAFAEILYIRETDRAIRRVQLEACLVEPLAESIQLLP